MNADFFPMWFPVVSAALAFLALAGVIILIVERRHQARSIAAALDRQRVETEERIAMLRREIADLEQAAQETGKALRGNLTRPVRSHAIQLLRSGVAPETAASQLGLARRDMQLVAKVFHIITG